MVARKMKLMPAYEAFGNELSPPVAFLQAASVLDITAALAVKSCDIEQLTTVAALWMQLGERLLGGPEDGTPDKDEIDLDSTPKNRIGFAGISPVIKEEELVNDRNNNANKS